ncbi:unnamed protein product [Adineta ricciae]|uniref:FAD dependent oxidoreductase n=2 Tax=Adineta ricciae TaxID=249248 RepID=A0A814R6J2_ADIRI|nr:unnamed protein product [Adineta ricciae]
MLLHILVIVCLIHSIDSSVRTIDDCQLLIVGGTTSALGAIITASKFLKGNVCVLEPTDWIGGQLSAELLSAPDFAFHTVKDKDTNYTLNVGSIDRQMNNQNPLFAKMLAVLGDTGRCWVSPKCSIPNLFHSEAIVPELNNTRIFYNTVIKRINKDASGRRIIQIEAIQRTSIQSSTERCRFLSEELPDWYSPIDSAWFTKTQLLFTNMVYVMEGSSWGEVLVLSNASYLQGLMERFDGDTSGVGDSTCGQSFTFDFLQQLRETPADEPPNPLPEPTGGANYTFQSLTWERIWTYRRVNTSAPNADTVAANDITIQNWSGGNDYRKEFFFLSLSDAQHQRDTNQWQGGVNLDAIQNAERQAYGYHYWYRKNSPAQWANRTVLVRSVPAAGTCHGLAKMPYLRESRRSIGVGEFLMNITTISGHARDLHGYIFEDRLCIGAYDVDVHPMQQCTYPSYMNEYYPILPYYVPLRAMTNRDVDNLIVIGKTMAQSFLVNSATRLHPVEFSIGQAAGVVGAYAVQNKLSKTADMLEEAHLKRVQTLVKIYTPMSWTIHGTRYPDD